MRLFRWLFGGATVLVAVACSSFSGDDAQEPQPAPIEAGSGSDGGTTGSEGGAVTEAGATDDAGLPLVPFEGSFEDDCTSWESHHDVQVSVVDDGSGRKACVLCVTGPDGPPYIQKDLASASTGDHTISMRARASKPQNVAIGMQFGQSANGQNFTASVVTSPAFTKTLKQGSYNGPDVTVRITLEIDGKPAKGDCVEFDSVKAN